MDQTVAPQHLEGSLLADRYRLGARIARGGMGEVFEAEDVRLRRTVAVKVFRSGPAADRARFDKEVTLLASLDHPGLVRVFDAGEHDGDAFVVLELVDGPTLAERIGRGRVPPAEVAAVGEALADALAYVHSQGVVHRDVTPSNIICGPDGRPKLADFGIARLVDSTRLTASATTIGTAAYMAPEQVQGHDVTPAADVYALGLVLLQLLTGRRAFEGTPHEVAVARLVRPPDTTTDVPGPWRDLLAAMTSRAAPNRPSASQVRERIAAVAVAADRSEDPTGAAVAVTAPLGAAGDDEPTRALDPIASRTTVLPVTLVPAPEPSPGAVAVGSLVARMWGRRWLLAAIVAVVGILAVGTAASGDGIDMAPPATTVPSGPETTTTIAPTTTMAPTTTTEAPPPEPKPGKGKGREKGEDDDD